MKKISIYRPTTVDEAIQILSSHGTEAGVYAGGTDLLIRLKNRLLGDNSYYHSAMGGHLDRFIDGGRAINRDLLHARPLLSRKPAMITLTYQNGNASFEANGLL